MNRKRIISLVCTLTLVLSLITVPAMATDTTNHYYDINDTDWFYRAVQAVSEAGFVNGVGDGRFNPNATITKLQFITMMVRYGFSTELDNMKEYYKSQIDFYESLTKESNSKEYKEKLEDYERMYNTWYYIPIETAISVGLFGDEVLGLSTSQISNLEMGIDSTCTRDEMAACVYWILRQNSPETIYMTYTRLANLVDGDIIPDIDDSTYQFAVQFSVAAGILNGVDETRRFNPNGEMTRAQACQVIYKLMDKSQRTPLSEEEIARIHNQTYFPEQLASTFNKSLKDLGIQISEDFDSIKGVKSNLTGLNYYIQDDMATLVGRFTDTEEIYNIIDYKSIHTRNYKIIGQNVFVANLKSTKYIDIDTDTGEYKSVDTYQPAYFIYEIYKDKMYVQRIYEDTFDEVIFEYHIISPDKAEEMQSSVFILDDAQGTWKSNNREVIVIDNDNIIVNSVAFDVKTLGDNEFELSSKLNGSKATYTIWKTHAIGGTETLLAIRFYGKLDEDILGIYKKNERDIMFSNGQAYIIYFEKAED